MSSCQHENFEATVNVGRILKDNDADNPYRYSADVRVRCADCGKDFRFIGLPAGLDINGAATSVDGTEGRFAIAPAGEVISQLDDDADVTGFTIRRKA